ncbi:MAG: hypothetical protein U1F53_03790 [Burkholderiaceae bacterium]
MRKELVVKSKSLAGTSDLTLLAPIKPGLVPGSLDAVTYKTRIKRLLEALNLGRAASHEYALLRPFSDAVERVGRIHSVRVTVFEPEDKVLLAVSFDGTWEAYIRVLWQKVGALLDVIFCNTEGYVLAAERPYVEWAAWVERVQRETLFYYGMPGLTVDDVYALRKEEGLHRECPAARETDLKATRQTVRSAEAQAWDTARHTSPAALVEAGRQALQSLSFVHRLTSLYPPGTDDGRCLRRAARELLREFIGLAERSHLADLVLASGKNRFDEQLAWLLARDDAPREVPPLPREAPRYDRDDVQAGIVNGYGEISHGCLALLRLDSRPAAVALLRCLRQRVSTDNAVPGDGGVYFNVAFTCEGLRAVGLDDAAIDQFPLEFRQGMEGRVSMLGDFRHNHPRRWRRPLRNWCRSPDGEPGPPGPPAAGTDGERVDLAAVHCVVQLRALQPGVGRDELGDDWVYDQGNPIGAQLAQLDQLRKDGVQIVAVEPMRRHLLEAGQPRPREHFGFADGESDPTIAPTPPGHVYDNQVQLGELLLGYDNQADFASTTPVPPLLKNGSFLVVRKLRQDVPALYRAVDSAVKDLNEGQGIALDRGELLGRMMGRQLSGDSLVTRRPGNDFDYGDDPLGRACPFHAHVRRANPRAADDDELPLPRGRRMPRLVRRGLSYGPTYDPAAAADTDRNRAERGLVFMAYNASIGEQFEVVQRWLTGGNSSGGYSGQSDPFVGVAPIGQKRHFRFEYGDQAVSVALDGADHPLDDPRPFVQVEWGAYLFAPSLSALDLLGRAAMQVAEPVWSAKQGLAQLAALPWAEPQDATPGDVEAWKAALEDTEAIEKFRAASLWAALRGEAGQRLHRPGQAQPVELGGAVRTPYGVLVVEAELAQRVLSLPATFSVKGYRERMARSLGEIFLGQDPDAAGAADPKVEQTNRAVMALSREEGFQLCFVATQEALAQMTGVERGLATQTQRPRWELNLNLRELIDKALQRLCQEWFGLEPADTRPPPSGHEFLPGSQRWDLDYMNPPRYPGHFTPPSRYIFQPHPGGFVAQTGEDVGRRLTQAMVAMVQRYRSEGRVPQRPARGQAAATADAPIAKAVFDAFEGSFDVDQVARYLVGVLMGMLPTLDGNLCRVLDEWLRDGSFWHLRQQLRELKGALTLAEAERVLLRPLTETMQLRPSPELIWRTAVQAGTLGGAEVKPGDKVVVAQVACTHAQLAAGRSNEAAGDLAPVFGGYRHEAVQRPGEPTHACPGYKAAMGALLGTLAGLLASGEPMRPSPARLAVNFEGPTDGLLPPAAVTPAPAPEAGAATPLHAKAAGATQAAAPPPARVPRSYAERTAARQQALIERDRHSENKVWLLAEGDSWFDDLSRADPQARHSLLARLEDDDHGFRIESTAQAGDSLKDMASDAQIAGFTARLRRMAALGRPPQAILLSAGGNDVVQQNLPPLLLPASKPGRCRLDMGVVRQRIEGRNEKGHMVDGDMAAQLRTLLGAYHRIVEATLGYRVPVVLHGYDYPVPDGRNAFGVPRSPLSWLYPGLMARGYTELRDGATVMQQLIHRLNRMQDRIAREFCAQGLPVAHADLRGTLSVETAGGAYQVDWANELHPTEAGFAKLADKLAERLGPYLVSAAQAGFSAPSAS